MFTVVRVVMSLFNFLMHGGFASLSVRSKLEEKTDTLKKRKKKNRRSGLLFFSLPQIFQFLFSPLHSLSGTFCG